MKPVLLELQRRIGLHNVTVTAAGIAFYGLLTLIPVLTALVASYALLTDDPAEIEDQVSEAAGALDDETQELISGQISDIVESMQGSATIVIIGSILLALFSASGTVQKLLGAIKLAYEVTETRPGWQVRIMSFIFTAAAIVLLVVLMSLISALPVVLDTIDLGAGAELAINLARLPVAIGLFMVGVTILYRYGPQRPKRTPWRNPGALVAAGLFLVFSIGLSVYTSNVSSLPASYGLLGSIAVLMIFLQLASLSVIVGAETNAAVEAQGAEAEVGAGAATTERSDGGRSPAEKVGPLSTGQAVAGFLAVVLFGRRSGSD